MGTTPSSRTDCMMQMEWLATLSLLFRLIKKELRRRGRVVTKKVAGRKMRLYWPMRARVTHTTASGENDAMRGRKEGMRGVVCDE